MTQTEFHGPALSLPREDLMQLGGAYKGNYGSDCQFAYHSTLSGMNTCVSGLLLGASMTQ